MAGTLIEGKSGVPETAGGGSAMPALIVRAGGNAEKRFLEFFAAQIRNRNTREAYLRAVRDFLDWAETEARIGALLDIEPLHIAAWVELQTQTYEAQSVKQRLAALRHLFDWLVTGHVLHINPAVDLCRTALSGSGRGRRDPGWPPHCRRSCPLFSTMVRSPGGPSPVSTN